VLVKEAKILGDDWERDQWRSFRKEKKSYKQRNMREFKFQVKPEIAYWNLKFREFRSYDKAAPVVNLGVLSYNNAISLLHQLFIVSQEPAAASHPFDSFSIPRHFCELLFWIK
jgi:hypothetical protein